MKDFFWVLLVSMAPVVELRAAIPLGCGLGLPWWQNLLAAMVGNLLPVPFVILFIRRIFSFLRTRWARLNGLIDRLEQRARQRVNTVERYAFWGLFFFVAIPLPGTGAWTGALIAALMDMRLKRALPSITLGVVTAGIIVTLLSYGVRLGVSAIG